MDIKELLGFLECERVERFQKVDSSVRMDYHALPYPKSFLRI